MIDLSSNHPENPAPVSTGGHYAGPKMADKQFRLGIRMNIRKAHLGIPIAWVSGLPDVSDVVLHGGFI
jgi:hypothetical protein